MRKIILLTMAFVLVAAASANAAELKIGLFNMGEVALDCDAFKDAQKKIQSTYGNEQKALENKEKDLQKKFEDFSVQQAGLSAEARQDRQVELMRLKRDHDDKKNDFMRKVTAAENKSREEITRVILIATAEYGKRNKYSLILDANSAGAIHVEPSMDVTADILKEANKVWKEKPKALTDGRPITTGKPRGN